MNEKRFFIDKIDTNQYAVYDRLKIGYIKPLVYTDWTVGLNYTQSVCDLLNDCDEKMNEVYEKLIIGKGSSEVIDMIKFGDNLNGVAIKELFDRNKKLEEDIDNEKNDYRELASNYIYIQEKNMKLEKENMQLKQQLFYDGDDVCDICKHRYLIPNGDYFLGKCKKEHEECSKEDTRYCKDFELKEVKLLNSDMFVNTLESPIIDITDQTEQEKILKQRVIDAVNDCPKKKVGYLIMETKNREDIGND